MAAYKPSRGGAHFIFVKRKWIMQYVPPQHRRHYFSSIQAITIDFAACRPSRAEVRPNLFSSYDSNRRRKNGTHCALKFLRGQSALRSKPAHLPQPVNSPTCPPPPTHPNTLHHHP